MTSNRPAVLSEKSAIYEMAQSYFSVTSMAFSPATMGFDETQGPKLPFTFRRAELWASGSPDARLAGFGPLFSGAVLFAAGLGSWIAACYATRLRHIALATALGLGVVSLSMPEAWWACYVPEFRRAPAIVGAVAVMSEPRRVRILGWALVMIMLLNSGFVSAGATLYVGKRAQDVRRQVGKIAGSKEKDCIFLGADPRLYLNCYTWPGPQDFTRSLRRRTSSIIACVLFSRRRRGFESSGRAPTDVRVPAITTGLPLAKRPLPYRSNMCSAGVHDRHSPRRARRPAIAVGPERGRFGIGEKAITRPMTGLPGYVWRSRRQFHGARPGDLALNLSNAVIGGKRCPILTLLSRPKHDVLGP